MGKVRDVVDLFGRTVHAETVRLATHRQKSVAAVIHMGRSWVWEEYEEILLEDARIVVSKAL